MGAFVELGKTMINTKKNMVISRMGDGKFAIAQQLVVDDEHGKPMNIFLKNSIVVDVEGLKRVRDLVGEILAKETSQEKSK